MKITIGGNQLSTYEHTSEESAPYRLTECVMPPQRVLNVYGSSRLGINTKKVDIFNETEEHPSAASVTAIYLATIQQTRSHPS